MSAAPSTLGGKGATDVAHGRRLGRDIAVAISLKLLALALLYALFFQSDGRSPGDAARRLFGPVATPHIPEASP
jgi:hypothetical protein